MHRAIQGQTHQHHLIHMELGSSIIVLYCGQPTYTIYFVDDRKLPDVILENNFVNIHPVLRIEIDPDFIFSMTQILCITTNITFYLQVFDHQNLHIHTFRVETLTQT